jgi:hypothetical protein
MMFGLGGCLDACSGEANVALLISHFLLQEDSRSPIKVDQAATSPAVA